MKNIIFRLFVNNVQIGNYASIGQVKTEVARFLESSIHHKYKTFDIHVEWKGNDCFVRRAAFDNTETF